MKMKKSKAYVEGYDFAIRCGEDNYSLEDEKAFEGGHSIETYNPNTTAKNVKLFDEGKIDATKFMQEINEKIDDADEILADGCLDSFIEEDLALHNIIEVCDNANEMEELKQKYSDGVSALIEFYKKAQVREFYDI